MSGTHDEIPPPPPPPQETQQKPTQQTPQTVSTIKLPILKKGEYDIWAMKIEHYLAHTDYPIWEVIQNGNGPVSVTLDTTGQIKILPPKTAEEMVLRERERKARTTLLMAIPEDHLAKFHKMTDAKDMWIAIKSRFGGNDESKKMQKYILKQQFEGFTVSNSDGIHKGYERFQSLLSQLEIHGAGVSTEDANQKFLRSLPSAWLQVSLIMRNKPGMDSLSFDDLYNNLRVFENDTKERIKEDGWNTGNREGRRTGNRDESITGKKEESKALVTVDGESVDWTTHSEDDNNYAFMANNSSGSDTQGLKKVEAQLVVHQQNQLWYEQKIKFMKIDLDDKTDVLTYHKTLLAKAQKEKDDLEVIKTSELVFNTVVNESHIEVQPKVWSDAPIIEEYESDSDDEFVSVKIEDLDTPSFANKQIKTPRENVKNQSTNSQKPKVNHKELGHGITQRGCFVCGSFSHLIRDCNYHVKLAKQVELHKQNMTKGNDSRERTNKILRKPTWNNAQRVNKQNQFVPLAVQTRTGTNPVNAAKASSTNNFSTARHSVNRQTVLTSTALKVNTVKPMMSDVRSAYVFHKTTSPSSRPFKRTTVLKTNLSIQKGYTAKDNPHRNLQNKGIIDSGCSRHMTGNKAYLADFQDINGGPVAFGGSKGYITGKGKIKTGKLDFEDVSFVKELQPFNLFSVSQMCDKKNKVLFTDTECLVLSPDFKLPDENQILLKVPRQNNMYSFNLENIVPLGGLACLIAKATTDESNLWHRRLGHVNFKNLNRLVKGNLVRGLPTKLFQNDHTCVACQKGKQHKTSCKPKLVSSISHTLQLLHMDLFGPTSVRSINHKTYCLVITDDFSRFSWTFFLRTKDETSAILKDFIRQIENQLNQKVKIIRCDNGTEFKNKEVIEFCGLKGIKREYSNARTPQQNGVAERKNMTLIEAARTMLADSFLPNTFWAEAVSTACYVLNRVLVTKPHNKTPYELLTGKTPIISYIRPFGCHVTILNTIDHLGKFVGKSDEGFLVGISESSCRPYAAVNKNLTQKIQAIRQNWLIGDSEKRKLKTDQDVLLNCQYGTLILPKKGVYQMDVKSAFLYGKIDEEVYVSQHRYFKILRIQRTVTMWYKLSMGCIKLQEHVQVYVDDIIFGSTKKSWCDEFEALMKSRFQMKFKGELTFFLSLQVKQKPDGIFISQDKYVAKILKKFDFASVKTASTPIETQKPLVKDEEAICAVLGFKVTSKDLSFKSLSQRFLGCYMGKPKLGLWYPRESSFDLESYSDSDYARANLDRKSTTGAGCIPLERCVPAHDEGASSERLSVEQTSPSPSPTGEIPNESLPDSSSAQPIEVPFEQQPEPSPKPSPRSSPTPSPTPIVPDSIPEPSGENLGDQVSDQAKEIKLLKAKITNLKKKAKPVIQHHKEYMKIISLQQRFPKKRFSKKQRVHTKFVSKQGRKKAKEESEVHRDPLD
ncbi:putative ribonuclease H-like domain-containing protein [Tanacetum coccineum]